MEIVAPTSTLAPSSDTRIAKFLAIHHHAQAALNAIFQTMLKLAPTTALLPGPVLAALPTLRLRTLLVVAPFLASPRILLGTVAMSLFLLFTASAPVRNRKQRTTSAPLSTPMPASTSLFAKIPSSTLRRKARAIPCAMPVQTRPAAATGLVVSGAATTAKSSVLAYSIA